MLKLNQAIDIIKKNIPDGKIQLAIEYNGLYVFQVFTDDEFEGQMDPFYSVNKETGEFSDFSIITDGDISELMDLFENHNIFSEKE